MANTKDELKDALKQAMRDKDAQRRDVLRQLTSAIKQVEIDDQKELDEAETIAVLNKQAKQRRESIDELSDAGRDIAQEAYELALIQEFLPEQLSPEKIREMASAIIAETGAESPKDMGKVMGKLQPQVKGRADGKEVASIVRELLSQ